MSITINQIYNFESKLTKLARTQRYTDGLVLINRLLNTHGMLREILAQKAFFLYHYAAYLRSVGRQTKKRRTLITQNFRDAVNICKQIINKSTEPRDRSLLNVRIYLAQIYAMNGNGTGAKKIAKITYNKFPSSLTAERAADVYRLLNDFRGAIYWYKRAIKLAKKPDEKMIAVIGLAVTYMKNNMNDLALKNAVKALQISRLSKRNMNITLLKQTLCAHFPQLVTC
ncbi:MAG: hypothetical protein A2928_00640 [Candidatus Taylorbacteria bacterium RIFCSPLOWO2_01_FULL_45_15b]|uniref:Tetratricopeptide repeat protein n=1 Tax=Candidatus Taylorbacteria bacterium RIFCSPLOWO2_01_FULL_45_15b TaxID=1802319 RepID=A0A1G2NCG5_9BACT|nr:MAG: hypothetical protein A2928_00640 [Candidatus Taylorbacteria bacterium RIFCSPLOWO2_01_FULL_45_15b]